MQFRILLAVTLTALVSIAANASISLVPEKVSNIETLRETAKAAKDDAVCGEVTEVLSTYVCVYKKLSMMNHSITRMGFFTGTANGYPRGTLIANSDPVFKGYVESISGHTVLGSDVSAFYATALASNESAKRPSAAESDFLAGFVRTSTISALNDRYAVIAFSNESSDYKATYRHEIFHAKFYLEPRFQQVIVHFWQNVITEEDKQEIRKALGQFYNANDERIMMDEFQAFILEGEEVDPSLQKFAKKYKPTLLQLLKQAGA